MVSRFYILKVSLNDLFFDFQSNSNVYSRESSLLRKVYQGLELSMLIEFGMHVVGYKNLSRYLMINIMQAYLIIFFVIDFYPSHKWVMCFIVVRCLGKLIRYMYHTYIAMGYKFRFYPFDWVRMTAFYILYPLESFLMVIIILATVPIVKNNQSLILKVNLFIDLDIDFSIFYFIFLCASLPNFLTTIIYLHSKRS